MLMAPLGGDKLGLLMIEVLEPDSRGPQAVLDVARRRWWRRGALVGPNAVVTFAGVPAVSMDVRLARGKVEREYRFLKAGALFSVGLVCHTDDRATLDTAAAVLDSWRWLDEWENEAEAAS